MERDVYIRKIYGIIKDQKKFKDLSTDPTISREGQRQRFVRSMTDKHVFTIEIYDKIFSSGSSQHLYIRHQNTQVKM